ncbi:YtxH-like protein [Scopulibacillus darangshiensis]|uniref:YtxH-like protein n=1 Tax=Scopulibacillus darangshiensis TaxID=442528 RepID=A0A4R2P6U6_9BACL|nr:YtxH domain-containing protein [Scopulibacillus darangshiensis]TCP30630.1 YtxH-like protein [Scopulibacillus darangshiensis]
MSSKQVQDQDQNNNSNSINTKDFIIGTFVGGMIGAFSALLLAPKSGEELRKDLGGQSKDVLQKSTEVAKSLTDQSQQLVGKAKEVAQNITSKEKEPYR